MTLSRFFKPWESIFIARYAKDILKKIPKILAGIEPGPPRLTGQLMDLSLR